MLPYIILLSIALLLSFFTKELNENRGMRKSIIFFFFSLLYFLFILRDINVGCDLPGYKKVYEQSMLYEWFDSSWTYMEAGYVFLMKLFTSLGVSFRGFMIMCYMLIVIPLGVYIYRYSKDVSLSLVIYICFQFFVLNMSGLRQSMAMSLCLVAFMVAEHKGIINFLKFLLIVIASALIHKSAIIFFFAYFVLKRSLNFKWGVLYLLLGGVLSASSSNLLQYLQDNDITTYEYDSSLTIGASFIMLLAVLIWSLFASRKSVVNSTTTLSFKSSNDTPFSLRNYSNMLAISLLLLLAFSGTVLMRASNYYNIIFLIMIPELFSRLDTSVRVFAKLLFVALMIGIFYFTVLVPSQFDIVPYKFAFDTLSL